MCVPGCLDTVGRGLSRRGLISGAGLATMTAAASAVAPRVRAAAPKSFSRVVDLTHAIGPDFPTYDGDSNLEMETLVTLAKDGYNMNRWLLVEHTGTHMDAPIHFGDGVQSADQIPADHLVVPPAIVDIRSKAQDDADAQLTPDDLEAFEAAHGPIPEGGCVAMLSGWDARASGPEFRNADADGVMDFPGFHVEAAQYLMGERNAIGIAVDTLSLDYGRSTDFATHYAWLPTNRWGPGGGREFGGAAADRRHAGGRRPQDQGRDRRPESGVRAAVVGGAIRQRHRPGMTAGASISRIQLRAVRAALERRTMAFGAHCLKNLWLS